jgi:hypothetical protein
MALVSDCSRPIQLRNHSQAPAAGALGQLAAPTMTMSNVRHCDEMYQDDGPAAAAARRPRPDHTHARREPSFSLAKNLTLGPAAVVIIIQFVRSPIRQSNSDSIGFVVGRAGNGAGVALSQLGRAARNQVQYNLAAWRMGYTRSARNTNEI